MLCFRTGSHGDAAVPSSGQSSAASDLGVLHSICHATGKVLLCT